MDSWNQCWSSDSSDWNVIGNDRLTNISPYLEPEKPPTRFSIKSTRASSMKTSVRRTHRVERLKHFRRSEDEVLSPGDFAHVRRGERPATTRASGSQSRRSPRGRGVVGGRG